MNKFDVNLTKNDLVIYHRLTNSDRIIIKALNRKHAEQIMNNKDKVKGINFSDISNIVEASNTSGYIDEGASVNSTENTRRRNS